MIECPGVSDGSAAPAGLRFIDAHVHLHPDRLGAAIRRHFEQEGWQGTNPWEPAEVAVALAAHGVERFCFFSYAHKPGMSASLNRWIAETQARVPAGVGLGTFHADDPEVVAVAAEATDRLGLRGFKLHLSVQRFPVDDARIAPIFERAQADGHVFVLHVGTMPYRDPFTGVAGFRRLMARVPDLRVCVAHMGAFETAQFLEVAADHPHVYLDTTMAMTSLARRYVGADPAAVSDETIVQFQDRIMFGSDFPLIPYDYDEERRWAWTRGLPPDVQRKIFYDNARRFFWGA